MNIVIISYFRNSSNIIDRYFDRIYTLKDLLWLKGHILNLVLGYGDSHDGTGELLFEKTAYEMGALLIECSHGGPEFGSIVDPLRFQQLSFVANKLRSSVSKQADTIIWLESDLIWNPEVLLDLILKSFSVPVIAPMVFENKSKKKFYDVFAFRRSGEPFTKESPYHPDLKGFKGDLLEMDSVGSCVVVQKEVFWQVSIPEDEVIVGMCKQIRDLGYTIYCDPSLRIYHP